VEFFGISDRVAVLRKVTSLTALLKNKTVEDADLQARFLNYHSIGSFFSSLD
jgi:hypothetical protein